MSDEETNTEEEKKGSFSFKIDFNRVATALVTTAIMVTISFATATVLALKEFKTVKKEVQQNKQGITILSIIACKYAVKEKEIDADEICDQVLNREKKSEK